MNPLGYHSNRSKPEVVKSETFEQYLICEFGYTSKSTIE